MHTAGAQNAMAIPARSAWICVDSIKGIFVRKCGRASAQAISWHMTKPYQHESMLAHATQSNVARVRLLATSFYRPFFSPLMSFQIHFHLPFSPFPFTIVLCRFILFHFYSPASVCVCARVYVSILFSSFYFGYIQRWSPLCTRAYTHSHLPYSCHGLFIGFIVVFAYVLFYL